MWWDLERGFAQRGRPQGLTQAELAARVGVTRSAVAQWETGRSGQVGGNLALIATSLGVGVEHLLVGDRAAITPDGIRGDELALIRLYRECAAADQSLLLRFARRLAESDFNTHDNDIKDPPRNY